MIKHSRTILINYIKSCFSCDKLAIKCKHTTALGKIFVYWSSFTYSTYVPRSRCRYFRFNMLPLRLLGTCYVVADGRNDAVRCRCRGNGATLRYRIGLRLQDQWRRRRRRRRDVEVVVAGSDDGVDRCHIDERLDVCAVWIRRLSIERSP